jgi:SSS family solute:Na+ symporter
MIAYVLFPGIKGDQAFPVLISSPLLPAGLKGLMVAAVLAAVMSSLSSVFNSAATIFTIDFYKLIRPLASEQKLVLVGRLSTMIMVIIAILWIPMTRMISNNVYLYLQSVQAYISPPITAVFVFGVMTDRVNARGAIWTLVIGGMIGFLRLVLEIINHNFGWVLPGSDWFIQLNFLHFAVFLFLVSTAILFLVSRASDLNMAEGGSGNRNFLKIVKNWGSSGLQPGWQKINFAFSILIAVVVLSLWGLFF